MATWIISAITPKSGGEARGEFTPCSHSDTHKLFKAAPNSFLFNSQKGVGYYMKVLLHLDELAGPFSIHQKHTIEVVTVARIPRTKISWD